MGNCWGTPVKTSQSPTTTRTSSPGITKSTGNEGTHSGTGSAFSSSLDEVSPNGQILPTPNLRIFSFAELKTATRNFRPDTVLGEGGFGRVFKGWVDEKTLAPAKVGTGMVIAVKKLNSEGLQGWEEWQVRTQFPLPESEHLQAAQSYIFVLGSIVLVTRLTTKVEAPL